MAKVKRAVDGRVKVRVLVACKLGAVDDVVEVDADQVGPLIGVVDANPAAVDYAESLRG